jgi:hypothetical protein
LGVNAYLAECIAYAGFVLTALTTLTALTALTALTVITASYSYNYSRIWV